MFAVYWTHIILSVFIMPVKPFTFCIPGEAVRTSREEIVSDTICVSNLREDVTVSQLVEQFSMVGTVKVSTFEQP